MLKIRLTRIGKKKQPHYRLVVAEHTAPIQGKFVEIVGNYNPFTKKVVLEKEKITAWMDKGAKPSNIVAKILTKEGFKHKSIVIKKFKAKSKKELEAEAKLKEEEKAKEQAEKEAKKVEFEQKVEAEKAEAAKAPAEGIGEEKTEPTEGEEKKPEAPAEEAKPEAEKPEEKK